MELQGKSVYEGLAIGKIQFVEKNKKYTIETGTTSNLEEEQQRFLRAREMAKKELLDLYEESAQSNKKENADILQMQALMVEDLDLEDMIMAKLSMGHYASYAIEESCKELCAMLLSMDDEYMKSRSADCKNIETRLLNCLFGIPNKGITLEEPSILVASDLEPSDLMQLDSSKLLGFVTTHGASNSHTAILARTFGIPAIVNTNKEFSQKMEGKMCIIDGIQGIVYIDPSFQQLEIYQARMQRYQKEKENREKLIGQKDETLDGKTIHVYCNIGNSRDVGLALKNDASGIGLFRSEFIYLEAKDFPTEEEQFKEYKEVLVQMRGRRVIMRTMDVGADKQAEYFHLPHEENPALGLRSLRICFARPEIMKTQLRALYRASVYGSLAIMIPMIISTDEVIWVNRMIKEVKDELYKEKIPYDDSVEVGIMIETPAAAIISDDLAQLVDFFSIGTNDLTQYTLAMDRTNQSLEKLYNVHHKAILRLMKMVVDNAHKYHKWVGICGELGRDLTLTEYFVGIQVDELSVSPSYVLPLREKIRSIDSKNVNLGKYIY